MIIKKPYVIILLGIMLLSCGKNPGNKESTSSGAEILFCIGDKVNVREKPDLKAAVTGILRDGEAVETAERSTHYTEISLRSAENMQAVKYNGNWLKIKTTSGMQGWAHSAFFVQRYFKRPDKKIEGLPPTSAAADEKGTHYYSPHLYMIGCSPAGLIAYLYYPTMNPACGSSYLFIENPEVKKVIYSISHCGLDEDVWDINKSMINRKLNEYDIRPADFLLEKGKTHKGECSAEFKLSLQRKRGPYQENSPWKELPISGYILTREGSGKKTVIAQKNFNSDTMYENVIFAGWFRNTCTEKIIAVIIRVEVGETFDFIETDTGCP